MTFANSLMFTGLMFIAAGGIACVVGFYLTVREHESRYLRTDQLQQWRYMTPEEAARTWIPLKGK